MVLREKLKEFQMGVKRTLHDSDCIHEDVNLMMLGEYILSVDCEKIYLPKAYFNEPDKSKEKKKSLDDVMM